MHPSSTLRGERPKRFRRSRTTHGPRRRAALAGLSLVACALVATACGDGDVTAPDLGDPTLEAFIALMNDHRVSIGCGPLSWRGDVAQVAQAHSEDMVDREYFSHYSLEGHSPFDRLAHAGIDYSLAAENLAYGFPSAEAVLDAWLDSPGHRANIEDCGLTQHGVGLRGTHWTHLFVTP